MSQRVAPQILLIDDDLKFGEALRRTLAPSLNLKQATQVHEGLNLMAQESFEVICVDYLLADAETGLTFIDRMKALNPKIPVIAISGNQCLEMSLGFLKRQVQGFLEKPFSTEEFLAIVLPWISLTQNARDRSVWSRGQWVKLTKTEFQIFQEFIHNPGKHLSREYLTQTIWPGQVVVKHTLDTHLLKIKQKLPEFALNLKPVYGTGFIYENPMKIQPAAENTSQSSKS